MSGPIAFLAASWSVLTRTRLTSLRVTRERARRRYEGIYWPAPAARACTRGSPVRGLGHSAGVPTNSGHAWSRAARMGLLRGVAATGRWRCWLAEMWTFAEGSLHIGRLAKEPWFQSLQSRASSVASSFPVLSSSTSLELRRPRQHRPDATGLASEIMREGEAEGRYRSDGSPTHGVNRDACRSVPCDASYVPHATPVLRCRGTAEAP